MNEISQNENGLQSNSNISTNLLNELLNPSIDLSMDYSEIFIDDLIENEVLKEIPIIKSIVGVIKGGISINQFWFAKKLLTFIKEFNCGDVETEKVEKYRAKLKTDSKYGKRIAEKLMVFIDRNIEITQTKIISNLFIAYVNEKITFEDFSNILVTLDKLNPKSYNAFFEMQKFDFTITEKNYKEVGERNHEMEALISNSGFGLGLSSWFHGFNLTTDGKKLFEFGIKPLK